MAAFVPATTSTRTATGRSIAVSQSLQYPSVSTFFIRVQGSELDPCTRRPAQLRPLTLRRFVPRRPSYALDCRLSCPQVLQHLPEVPYGLSLIRRNPVRDLPVLVEPFEADTLEIPARPRSDFDGSVLGCSGKNAGTLI